MRTFFLFAIAVSVLFFCWKTTGKRHSALASAGSLNIENGFEQKAEPYQFFAAQRADETGRFDEAAWRNAVVLAQKQAKSTTNTHFRRGNSPTPWTQQGPSNVAGRVNALAIYPNSSDTILAGFATGGIWRSTNGGLDWHSVFDEAEWCAIGDIAHAPSQPNIVYSSTGDPQLTGYTINGVGVFRSNDGGETWASAGMENGGVLSTLAVHPNDPNTVFVASMGNPFVRDAERGVYKTTDGGQTWTKMLNISNQAGCIDLVMNPQNPNVLYAAFWDRIRSHQESIAWGPNAKIYKTTDGGSTWTHLTNGLPAGNNCRIGLAISQTNPDKLYAVYCDTTYHVGGLYKSENAGQSWTSESIAGASNAYVGFGWYFGKLRLDPLNDEDIYLPGIILYRKQPNSGAFQIAAGAHADIHDVVFAPNGKRYLASDGGPYYNLDGTNAPWTKCLSLPTTQFYKMGINPHRPNWYYGGAQDNGTTGGDDMNPWEFLGTKDGFDCHFHPTNPNVYWFETQNGEISMTTDGGQTWEYGSKCLNSSDRCAWNTPYILSPHDPTRLYAGTHRLYTSVGLSSMNWSPISNDLTDGNVFGSPFHVISCLDESQLTAGKMLIGTSDGNVWRRGPSGAVTNITSNLPDVWVSSVKLSTESNNRLFVAHSALRANSTVPLIFRSEDNGSTWQSIAGNLPNIPINDLLLLPSHKDSILLAATDVGVYFTRNHGQNWHRLGENMPFVPVYELEYNPAQKEVAAATFGRSLWAFPADSILTYPTDELAFSISGKITDSTFNGGLNDYQIDQFPNTVDLTGNYVVENLKKGDTVVIRPQKNDDYTNGVNTYDLLIIQKHLLGNAPITSPLRLIAADANNSGSVTPSDIIELRKLILGIYPDGLPKVGSWRFIPHDFVFQTPLNPFVDSFPEERVFPNITQDFTGQDFIGLKVGNLDPPAVIDTLQAPPDDRSSKPLVFYVSQAGNQEKGREAYCFEADLSKIAAFQGTLKLPFSEGKILSVQPLYPDLKDIDFHVNTENNTVSFAAFFEKNNAVKQGKKTALFSISVLKNNPENVLNAWDLGEMPTPDMAFSEQGKIGRIELCAKADFGQSAVARSTISPNPMTSQSIFRPSHLLGGTLRCYSLSGQLVFEKKVEAGAVSVGISKEDFEEKTGVFVWKFGAESGKMVVVH